jgi:DNA-binding response OmpR family regulator
LIRRNLTSSESVPLDFDDAETTLSAHGIVIVIDDDDDARQLTADALRELGWKVYGAAELRSAVELAMEYQPRAIITELTLPAVHGYAFVRTLRSAVDHDLMLVGLTKLPSPQIDAARTLFDAVFEKPADITHIHERLLEAR